VETVAVVKEEVQGHSEEKEEQGQEEQEGR